jgi:hypothetical protein
MLSPSNSSLPLAPVERLSVRIHDQGLLLPAPHNVDQVPHLLLFCYYHNYTSSSDYQNLPF